MGYDHNNDGSHSSGQIRSPRKKGKESEKRKSTPPLPPQTEKATKPPPELSIGGRKTTGLDVDPPPDTAPKATVSTTTEKVAEATRTKKPEEEEEPGVSLKANPTNVPKKAGPAKTHC